MYKTRRYPEFERTCAIQYTSHESGAWRLGCRAPCASLRSSLPFVYRPSEPKYVTALQQVTSTLSPLSLKSAAQTQSRHLKHNPTQHPEVKERDNSAQRSACGGRQQAFKVQREELRVGHSLMSAIDVEEPALRPEPVQMMKKSFSLICRWWKNYSINFQKAGLG